MGEFTEAQKEEFLSNDAAMHVIRNLGYDDGMDPSPFMETFSGLDTDEAFDYWCGWEFGYRGWGDSIRGAQEQIKAAKDALMGDPANA